MVEIGESIMARSRYAMMQLNRLDGVTAPIFRAPHFQEFAVNLDGTSQTVAEVNQALLARGIFGGKDLSLEFPALGQSALYCVTETHTQEDIDQLVAALEEVVTK
jgi:glycine dehydrogenase subunit 1